jgi:LDH2 family malate/lactate/ureidoglycolate dehydrogenase
VATGRVKAALRDGEDVPPGWLVSRSDGSAVTSPAAYVEETADVQWLGGPLVTGGAKGFGLGLLVDLLCGPVAGAAFGPRREVLAGGPPADDTDIGHFVLALDMRAFGDREAIEARAGELLSTVAACPPAGYTTSVTYPGAPEATRARTADLEGVPLDKPVAAAFAELLDSLGIETPEVMRP